jgi:hypothetical protein
MKYLRTLGGKKNRKPKILQGFIRYPERKNFIAVSVVVLNKQKLF